MPGRSTGLADRRAEDTLTWTVPSVGKPGDGRTTATGIDGGCKALPPLLPVGRWSADCASPVARSPTFDGPPDSSGSPDIPPPHREKGQPNSRPETLFSSHPAARETNMAVGAIGTPILAGPC
jgi:hypothetical protein